MLGTKTLQDILSDREAIANQMETHLDEGSAPWGIKIERVEMYIKIFYLFITIYYYYYYF